jgi:hypothetical protein
MTGIDIIRTFEELASDPIPTTLLNEAPAAENVGVLVPGRQRSLHAVVVQRIGMRKPPGANLAAFNVLLLCVAVLCAGQPIINKAFMRTFRRRGLFSFR